MSQCKHCGNEIIFERSLERKPNGDFRFVVLNPNHTKHYCSDFFLKNKKFCQCKNSFYQINCMVCGLPKENCAICRKSVKVGEHHHKL